ncbi:alpha-(1,6)-fucosyltransferase-like [Penaeus chinensis]|uniref:alpha-(1,6)-fucosyltransferase-like n=1 Tax=Penaeus chinensis TaxID=139456 RepID=UPI001FB7B92C|nr:alpha-(1,6)-fucosyltransferase-like [Penaeus chinensis]
MQMSMQCNRSVRQKVTQFDLWRLRNESGLLAWQAKEVEELSALIQHRIHVLQNPADCKSSKKIICRLPVQLKRRGIGSQLHHLSYCFLAAYGMQRTLIIDSSEAVGTGFAMDPYFLPLSETCVHANGTAAKWPGEISRSQSEEYSGQDIYLTSPCRANTPVVQFPSVDRFVPRPRYFPRSVPKDIARRLMSAHSDPFAWWMGQFFKYALRMTSAFREHVERLGARLGYEGPIVGWVCAAKRGCHSASASVWSL